jgi:pantetheine-phosphate adenylyltransferase
LKTAVCSGSFDPVTNGHIDIFERASRIFDELIVCVFNNIHKDAFFTVQERVALLEEATRHIPNLRVRAFSGLLVDYMHEHGASVIVRGMRSVTDYEYERKEEQMQRFLAPDIETMFFLTSPEYAFVSSSGVREVARFHGPVEGMVPACVAKAIRERTQADMDR